MSVHDCDYSKVKEALGIPEDEPIFVLRAQDVFSVPTIARYRNFAAQMEAGTEPSQEWFDNIDKEMESFQTWQGENRTVVKVPD
jgi:hypothetical protein